MKEKKSDQKINQQIGVYHDEQIRHVHWDIENRCIPQVNHYFYLKIQKEYFSFE